MLMLLKHNSDCTELNERLIADQFERLFSTLLELNYKKLILINIVSSPEPLGSQGELIGWP